MSQVSDWQIPREERKRILAGNRQPLTVKAKPPLELGDKLILSWLRPKPYADRGERLQAPPSPEFWIIVTGVHRKAKEGWSVTFDTHDHRDRKNWLILNGHKIDILERVDKAIEGDFAKAARERERQAGEELVLAALEVRQVLRERVSSRKEFRAIAGLSIRRLDKEIDRLINHTRRKAA